MSQSKQETLINAYMSVVLPALQDLYIECEKQRGLPGSKRNWNQAIVLTDICERKKIEFHQLSDVIG